MHQLVFYTPMSAAVRLCAIYPVVLRRNVVSAEAHAVVPSVLPTSPGMVRVLCRVYQFEEPA